MSENNREEEPSPAKAKLVQGFKYFVLPLAIVFITELMYRQHFWDQSLEQIPEMQQVTKLSPFFEMVSKLGQSPYTFFFFVGTFNLMPKLAALYFWCAMAVVSFICNELKSLYGHDRPYWVSDEIKSEHCMLSFGNPSGHMLNNTFFWVSLYLHAYCEVGVKYPRMSVFCTAYIIKMAATCLMITFLLMMAFSRVYLGVHSINQVIFGSVLAITLAFIGHYKIKPLFLNLSEMLYTEETGSKYAVTRRSYFKAIAFGVVMPLVFASFVLLMSDERAFHDSNEYRYRQANAGCSASRLSSEADVLHYGHFEGAGSIAMVGGAFCGQFLEYRMFVNTGVLTTSAWTWYKASPAKTIVRTLITLGIFYLFLWPRTLANEFEHQIDEDQPYLRALVKSCYQNIVPYFVGSFLVFGLLRFLFAKLKLDNQEATQKEFQTREEYLNEIGLELVGADNRGLRSTRNAKGSSQRNTFEDTIELEETI